MLQCPPVIIFAIGTRLVVQHFAPKLRSHHTIAVYVKLPYLGVWVSIKRVSLWFIWLIPQSAYRIMV